MADPIPRQTATPRSLRLRIATRIGWIVAASVALLTAAGTWKARAMFWTELSARVHAAAGALAVARLRGGPEEQRAFAARALDHLPDGAFVALRAADGTPLAISTAPGFRLDPTALGDAIEGVSTRVVGGEAIEESIEPLLAPGGEPRFVQVGVRRAPTARAAASLTWVMAGIGLLVWLSSVAVGALAAGTLAEPLEALARAARGVARVQLHPLPAPGRARDDLGSLAGAFQSMVESLQGTHRDLHEASSEIAAVVAELHAAAASQTQAAGLQWDAMSRTGRALEEMTASRALAVQRAAALIRRAEEAEHLSSEGMRVIGEALAALQELSDDVRAIASSIARQSDLTVQIGSIASVVRDLAEQSNMLALNAAVEAARAGEKGLGFAVVAQEMRGLAGQSKEASARIRLTLADANRAMRESLKLAEAGAGRADRAGALAQGAGEFIGRIAEAVRESYAGAKQIASSTDLESGHVDEIASAMAGLSSTAQRTRDGSARLTLVGDHLGGLSRRLGSLLARLSRELPGAPAAPEHAEDANPPKVA